MRQREDLMPKKYATIGFACMVCGHQYPGKGSYNRALACEKNPIPKPILVIGAKYIMDLPSGGRLAFEITGVEPYAILDARGLPTAHKLTYKANSFARIYPGKTIWYKEKDDHLAFDERVAHYLKPWDPSIKF